MKHILTIIKGFFIGIANIIPGVSGGTLAMILNIYDKLGGFEEDNYIDYEPCNK